MDPAFSEQIGPGLAIWYEELLARIATVTNSQLGQAHGLTVHYTNTHGRDLRVAWQHAKPFENLLCIEDRKAQGHFYAYTRAPRETLPEQLEIFESPDESFRIFRGPPQAFIEGIEELLDSAVLWAEAQLA